MSDPPDRHDLQRDADAAFLGLPFVSGVDADVAANQGTIKVLVVSTSAARDLPREFRGYPIEVVDLGSPPTIQRSE